MCVPNTVAETSLVEFITKSEHKCICDRSFCVWMQWWQIFVLNFLVMF